ncbi:4723_t:CDS:2, partial [Scutellospora calospora]
MKFQYTSVLFAIFLVVSATAAPTPSKREAKPEEKRAAVPGGY